MSISEGNVFATGEAGVAAMVGAVTCSTAASLQAIVTLVAIVATRLKLRSRIPPPGGLDYRCTDLGQRNSRTVVNDATVGSSGARPCFIVNASTRFPPSMSVTALGFSNGVLTVARVITPSREAVAMVIADPIDVPW